MTLEQFIDESIQVSRTKGYHPTTFMRMRADYGTVGAIRRLVETGEKQSGFVRLRELGLLDWSLEAAVIKFPDEPGFTRTTIAYAEARLQGILDA
ncbi:hypothetical protein V5F59_09485 [Xanthobacter autotrophicus DSM 431]|uniref:hypothetical protein n=1 Tax=Xanthobacter nonsaccharivorans TaxID=3119912 RepID=UPI003728DE70